MGSVEGVVELGEEEEVAGEEVEGGSVGEEEERECVEEVEREK